MESKARTFSGEQRYLTLREFRMPVKNRKKSTQGGIHICKVRPVDFEIEIEDISH